jgi:hypothetical protein
VSLHVANASPYERLAFYCVMLLGLGVLARMLVLCGDAQRAGLQAYDSKRLRGATFTEARAASFFAQCATLAAAFDVCCLPCTIWTWLIAESPRRVYERFGGGDEEDGARELSWRAGRMAAISGAPPRPRRPPGSPTPHKITSRPTIEGVPATVKSGGAWSMAAGAWNVNTVLTLLEPGEKSPSLSPSEHGKTPRGAVAPPPVPLPRDSWLYNGEPWAMRRVQLPRPPATLPPLSPEVSPGRTERMVLAFSTPSQPPAALMSAPVAEQPGGLAWFESWSGALGALTQPYTPAPSRYVLESDAQPIQQPTIKERARRLEQNFWKTPKREEEGEGDSALNA